MRERPQRDLVKRFDRASHAAFLVGVIFKGLDGCLELAGAAILLLITQQQIVHIVALLTRGELAEDPGDLLANYALRTAQHLSAGTQHFAALYLLAHGAIKVGLVVGLLRGLRWSYPTALACLAAFTVYQSVRLYRIPSWALGLFTLIDGVVMVLIWHEWRQARRRWSAHGAR